MWEMAPNPGRIRMYTSGWPKNQNKCWNKTGSPPPPGSKNDVLEFRSVNNIVIAPAKTGRDRRSRIVVTLTDQINRGRRFIVWGTPRATKIVEIKLIDPMIEEAPAKWSEKMTRSTDPPEWPILDKGGYTVQPVPAPLSTIEERRRRARALGSSQNLRLFNRGKIISGLASIRGSSQFPKPPIRTGITRKKIIKKA